MLAAERRRPCARAGTSGRCSRGTSRASRARTVSLRADDVPAERLVAVEELLVDAADEVARRVVVHVHLLDDHALLALDLLGVELRVAEHVDEHVERDVAVLGRALDVVAGVLLAGERVELAADRVDLASRCRARSGARSVPLKNMCSAKWAIPFVSARLVARAGGEHDEAGDRLRLRHAARSGRAGRCRGLSLEDAHRRPASPATPRAARPARPCS